MRITHLVRQYRPGIGGVESFVEALARGQVNRGNDVSVVTLNKIFDSNDEQVLAQREIASGVTVIRVPYVGSRKYPLALGAIRHVRKAEILHVHGVDFFADYMAATKVVHRRPLVISTHGGFFHTDFAAAAKKIWFQTITRASLSRYECVAACSVQDMKTFLRVAPRNTMLVENAVDVSKFADLADRSANRIIYFGRLAPNKNLSALLGWFSRLRASGSDWNLVIAGKEMGTSIGELKSIADACGVAGYVEFVPAPSDGELKTLISQCSAFACASNYEGFGLAAVEAGSAGLLPVLSDIPPFRRTVEQLGFGLLLDFGCVDSHHGFLDAIARHRQASISGAELRDRLLPFEWPRLLDQMERVYEAALSGGWKRGAEGSHPVL